MKFAVLSSTGRRLPNSGKKYLIADGDAGAKNNPLPVFRWQATPPGQVNKYRLLELTTLATVWQP